MVYAGFMSRFHTFILTLLILPQGLPATAASGPEPAEIFAVCSGRMAALATRQRAFGQPEAAEQERLRQTFDQLLEATRAAELTDVQAESWRMTGWREVATLLADSDYSTDARRAQQARATLAGRIATCRNMVL